MNTLAVSIVLSGLVVGGPLLAQAPPRPGGPPPEPAVMTPAQVQQLFDAMLVMQAQQTLSLSEDQYARFLTRLKVLQDTRRRNLLERARLISELQRLTNERNPRPNVEESDIKQRLTDLAALEVRTATEVQKAYAGIDEVLDVRQQARFRVFEEQIERRKLELVARARQQIQQSRRPPR